MTISDDVPIKAINLYNLKRLQEKAEEFNLILDILAGQNGYGIMNSSAIISIPSAKGTSPITVDEEDWRELLRVKALTIAEYLVSYGIRDNTINGYIKARKETLATKVGTGK